jgi:hypothetical protein
LPSRKNEDVAGQLASGGKINSLRTEQYDILHCMTTAKVFLTLALVMLSGCSSNSSISPGATLLSGIGQYQVDMDSTGNSLTRWPERQRAGGTLKTIITATVGGSREFYRLVDLDVRKREFSVTMSDGSVRPDRMQEMKEELVKMDEEIAALKPIVRAQVAAIPARSETQSRIESAAASGLLDLAVQEFSVAKRRGPDAPATVIDQYIVTDLGSFATVRGADGQIHRCTLYSIPDEGAGIRCEPIK